VHDLKKLGLWTAAMLDKLKHADGDLSAIPEIPETIKARYREAFDIDPVRLIEFTAVRGKWIDQSQSHNVFMRGTSGSQLHRIYLEAWERGLKTTYYLRTLAASQIEKSTLDASFGYTQKRADKAAVNNDGPTTAVESVETSQRSEIAVAEAPKSKIAVAPLTTVADDGDLAGVKACLVEDPTCEACQ
jgi:ribonucleoside-diphosphate reductase alpha chain